MKIMTISEYQQHLDRILQEYEKPYWQPLSILARLTEETGEVARIMNHKYGDKPKKDTEEHEDLADELADVVYSAICIANSEGIDLQEPLMKAIEKLTIRDKDRFAKKK